MSKIRVVVFRVNQAPVVEEIENDLETIQALVEGYVQSVPIGEGIDLLCNEDRGDLPFNALVTARASKLPKDLCFIVEQRGSNDPPFAKPGQPGYHQIHGTFFFARTEGAEMASLTDEDIATLLATRPEK